MKISCSACGSNYAIADEKVAGRLVKVRCKSCGAAIVVDGRPRAASEAPGPSAAPAAANEAMPGDASLPPPSSPDSWSVNLSETDSRNMTTAEIVTAYAQGLLADAYVWKEGMDDWAPLLAVPELAAAIDAQRPAAAAPRYDGGTRDAAADAVQPSLFGGGAAATRAAATRGRASPDLFGQVAQAGSEEEARQALAEEPDHKLVGARNENSVLFSLDALKAGVTGNAGSTPSPGRPAPRAPGRPEPGARRDAAPDDPFGLGAVSPAPFFDPNANFALMNAPPPPEPKPEPKRPKPVESVAAVAVAPPTTSRFTVALAIGGTAVATLAIVGVALAIFSSRTDGDAAATGSASSDTAATAAPTTTAAPTATESAAASTTAAPSESASAAPEVASAEAAPERPMTPEEKKALEEAMAKKREEDAKRKAEATAAADAAKKEAAGKREAAAVAAGFDRGAAAAALTQAASAATSCKRPDGPTGSGRVTVTFAPSGRATTANVVGGGFGGTSVGGCIASVFRSARVPPFDGGPVTVSKSFNIP